MPFVYFILQLVGLLTSCTFVLCCHPTTSNMPFVYFILLYCSGGLTNKLYRCTLLSSNYQYKEDEHQYPNTVLLRVYGLILEVDLDLIIN